MKKKDIQAMHDMKPAELLKVMGEAQKKLADYMINRYSKQSKNVREGASYRKKIAVASTILSEKELQDE